MRERDADFLAALGVGTLEGRVHESSLSPLLTRLDAAFAPGLLRVFGPRIQLHFGDLRAGWHNGAHGQALSVGFGTRGRAASLACRQLHQALYAVGATPALLGLARLSVGRGLRVQAHLLELRRGGSQCRQLFLQLVAQLMRLVASVLAK